MINLSGVFRNKKRANPFVQIDKNMLSDEKISWKAKGILAYLLSKPDGWKTYATDIENQSSDGRDAVASGIKELIATGYMEREQVRVKGRFKGYEYSVYEYPKVTDLTDNGFPDNGKTDNGESENGFAGDGKTATSNNNLSNNDFSNNDFNNNNDNAGVENELIETPFQFYEKNGFGILTPHIGQKVGAWIDDTNNELVIHAMKISLENGHAKWSYTEAILKDWHHKKLTSVSDIVAFEEQRRQQFDSVKKQTRFGTSPKEEIVPDWFKKDEHKKAATSEDFDIAEERRRLQAELGSPQEQESIEEKRARVVERSEQMRKDQENGGN